MKVFAVVVIYNPVISSLLSNLQRLNSQVDGLIIIDNSNIFTNYSLFDDLKLIKLLYNNNLGGIAGAQNLGIECAIENGADFILFMDQDSSPAENMVRNLFIDFNYAINNNILISAIGPEVINSNTNMPFVKRLRSDINFSFYKSIFFVGELISSGTLIPSKNFEIVGLFNELLFIDGVDHEWCWRANKLGYKCIRTNRTRILHNLGEGDRYFLGVRVSISSPFRIYFQFRNYIYLCSKSHVPNYWKVINLIKYFIKFFYLPIFVSPRYFPRILNGLRDGFSMVFKEIKK